MVRFKNRHLLVEFLTPSTLDPIFLQSPTLARPSLADPTSSPSSSDDEEELTPIPQIPFLSPTPKRLLNLGSEGGSLIYRALRSIILELYGDEGWGRVASNFKVIYHSPLTTLTMLRVARQHYRLIWGAVSFITRISDQPVLPRVVGVSGMSTLHYPWLTVSNDSAISASLGTIKKLQNRAIEHHRFITAHLLLLALNQTDSKSEKEDERSRLQVGWDEEIKQIASLDD
ncbi:ribonuclease P/MRP protein subunit POP5, partial [Tremellales sp. Uapishka_1]